MYNGGELFSTIFNMRYCGVYLPLAQRGVVNKLLEHVIHTCNDWLFAEMWA